MLTLLLALLIKKVLATKVRAFNFNGAKSLDYESHPI